MKRARLREETTARRFLRKVVRCSDSLMAVRSSDALSGSTSLEREINWKSFGIGMSSYSGLARRLDKGDGLRVSNREGFLWSDFLELSPGLLMETADPMGVDRSSGAAKRIRKS